MGDVGNCSLHSRLADDDAPNSQDAFASLLSHLGDTKDVDAPHITRDTEDTDAPSQQSLMHLPATPLI